MEEFPFDFVKLSKKMVDFVSGEILFYSKLSLSLLKVSGCPSDSIALWRGMMGGGSKKCQR
jgi:hypothetical protein